jgi:redox-sensitive bicupin YhaK (pirin superfamily)
VSAAVEVVTQGRQTPLGGLTVRRMLPVRQRRSVGPFVFFDHLGPTDFAPGTGMDVGPHPHIGLATVTYLFEGAAIHRDSLGSVQPIHPGDVNWMTAGRGIVHSERTGPEQRAAGGRLHGIQIWVALPLQDEEMEPSFRHHPASTLPESETPGTRLRVVAGAAYGHVSPVQARSELFYVQARLQAGAELPAPEGPVERAIYVLEGSVDIEGQEIGQSVLAVLKHGVPAVLRASAPAHVVLFGGQPLEGPRLIWWNYVSSDAKRIERAQRDWAEDRFPRIPGETERVPQPEVGVRPRPAETA